jgi:hypothetical protein
MKKIILLILVLILSTTIYLFSADTKIIKPKNAKSKVSIIIAGKSRNYYPLSVKEPSIITVRGPGKLEIISRAEFIKNEKPTLNYKIYYRIDGNKKTEMFFKNITRSNDAIYKEKSLGIPGTGKRIVLDLGSGEHTIELWLGAENPKVAARYLFTQRKDKKIDWVTLSPMSPNEPVNLIAAEELVQYYRFSQSRPLKIQISGPTTFKVLTRIENHYGMKGRINYRLQVKENGKVKHTYQLNSVRSETTHYKNVGSKIPGKAKEIVIDVPSGRHSYEILPLDKDKNTILGRILFPKKDIGLGE